ncbi:hypothetical protein PAESOLCIP111_00153 [Paenibacillus solanacearum]|uniref:Uncharacterized protein n=1 Tax=Paenibacillus solanacearum TaxID=2048548 RepID=A0A916JSJ9_9BACL|nr:CBO0543 family protein [Paenibacillus solanacearum]CAG7597523.1 hypothetical protein PAESOLCIP111_00153 [Paenibacillus solanacearum]
MNSLYALAFAFAGYKWGDWKNWKAYYSTILFWIVIDLVHSVLTYHYTLWEFHTSFDKALLPNHTFISFTLDFISFPATVLIYLGHYPSGLRKQALYIFSWALFFTLIELLTLHTWKGISHHHGWNIWWSVAINLLTFPMLRLHYKHPLWAWLLSLCATALFWNVFDVPLGTMK